MPAVANNVNDPFTVELNIGTGKSITSVKHNGTEIPATDYTYDSTTGILTFETTSFSPFEIEFVQLQTITGGGASMIEEDDDIEG